MWVLAFFYADWKYGMGYAWEFRIERVHWPWDSLWLWYIQCVEYCLFSVGRHGCSFGYELERKHASRLFNKPVQAFKSMRTFPLHVYVIAKNGSGTRAQPYPGSWTICTFCCYLIYLLCIDLIFKIYFPSGNILLCCIITLKIV